VVLILDEADRMLDMGFIHDIRRIIKLLPKKRQTLLFSATFSNEIRELAKGIVYKAEEVSVSPPNSTVKAVKQSLIPVEKSDKTAVLTHLLKENNWFQVLVFSRTKHGANKLVKKLDAKGIEAAAIHGNKSQGARTRALADFKDGKCRVLVATDIAARGIDIDQLPYVVNFDLPQVAEDYVHRIGRTGRAGASGEAISLVSHDEFKQLVDIERLIKKEIPREELSEFPPKNNLPASKGDFRDFKAKKPKKKKPSNRSRSSGNEQGNKTSKLKEGDAKRGGRNNQSPNNRKKKPNFKKRRRPNNNNSGSKSSGQGSGNKKPSLG